MASQLFYVKIAPESLPILNNVPSYYKPFNVKGGLTNCVEHTLWFLNVLTDETASKRSDIQQCTKLGTTAAEIISLLEEKHPDYTFTSQNSTFKYLTENLRPNSATICGLNSKIGGMGHAVIFVKNADNILYLVDRQENVKYGCDNINIYFNQLQFDNINVNLFFAESKKKRTIDDIYSPIKKQDVIIPTKMLKTTGGKKRNTRKTQRNVSGKKRNTRKKRNINKTRNKK